MRIISLMRLRSSMRMIGAACKLLSCQCSGQGPKMGWGIITPNFMAMLKGKMTFHARGLGCVYHFNPFKLSFKRQW